MTALQGEKESNLLAEEGWRPGGGQQIFLKCSISAGSYSQRASLYVNIPWCFIENLNVFILHIAQSTQIDASCPVSFPRLCLALSCP